MSTAHGNKPLPNAAEVLGYAVSAAFEAAASEIEEGARMATREGMLWLGIARELREGATQPLIDRAMDRLTLHDIEGIVCSHGRVAIQHKNSVSARFVHSDDGSNCAAPDPETEHFRRRVGGARGLGCSLHGGISNADGWIECGLAVCGHEPQQLKGSPLAEPNTYGTTMAGMPTYGAVEVTATDSGATQQFDRPGTLEDPPLTRPYISPSS